MSDPKHVTSNTIGRLKFAAFEAAQVIDNLLENGPEQGFGYWNEAGHWQDGERVMRDLRALAWVDGLDATEDAPCPECGGDGYVPSDVSPYETSYGPSDTECATCAVEDKARRANASAIRDLIYGRDSTPNQPLRDAGDES